MLNFGVDVSKSKLDVLWLRDVQSLRKKRKTLTNGPKAHEAFLAWAERVTGARPEQMHVVIEPTHVYHEAFATGLNEAGVRVSLVNAHKVRQYAQGLGWMNKSDPIDSLILAQYGTQAPLRAWQPEPAEIRHLKALLDRLHTLDKEIRREDNRLEKARYSDLAPQVTESIEQTLAFLRAERQRIEQSIDDHIDRHPQLKHDRELLQSVPGVGSSVSSYMIALLRGRRFKSGNQAAAFIGLNPVFEQSGTTVRKRTRLSKHGSAWFRSKLYMPAIVSKQYNPDIKALYERLLANGKAKMAALGAAMRKLVVICYGVLKHQTPYQPRTSHA